MKPHLLLMPLALLTAPAQAMPPPAKAYDCAKDGSKAAFRLKFGAGEYSAFNSNKNEWDNNSCADAKDCKFKGTVFTATFGPNFFTYDRATAHYVMADMFGDVTDHGTCVPE